MTVVIERLVGLAFLVVGLSHLLQPRGWAAFFVHLSSRGTTGAFANGLLSLNLGVLVVAAHGTQWRGIPAIVTFIGWGQLAKGCVNLLAPRLALRSMSQVPEHKAWKFALAGGIMIPVALLILYGTLGVS